MRTNIDIDDDLLAEAMKLSGNKTKKATVDAALKILIRIENQKKFRDYFGKLHWEGELDAMRLDRKEDK